VLLFFSNFQNQEKAQQIGRITNKFINHTNTCHDILLQVQDVSLTSFLQEYALPFM
jgi:hypothetical protein